MTDPTSRIERWLVLLTPWAALAVVALGLRVGAPSAVRAAVVYGAPPAAAETGAAWQVVVFQEDHGVRESLAGTPIEVTARGRDGVARWSGATNEDGVAEAFLGGLAGLGRHVSLDVHSAGARLASGDVSPSAPVPRARPRSAWVPFAHREGPVVLDVAVLGQRVASGFPASVWVRASDATTRLPLAGVTIEPERDSSLSVVHSDAQSDAGGWAGFTVIPMGHAVPLTLHARDSQGRTGEWAGALFVSPGGAQIVARHRYAPEEEPALDVVVPNERATIYVEIDDAQGRAWAGTVDMRHLAAQGGAQGEPWPRVRVNVPPLAPALYWAVTSGDPGGASQLGPGTMTRPFVVAATDEAGLAFGTDPEQCAARSDPRDAARALPVCLALAAAAPVPRWIALDGFSGQRAKNESARAKGLGLALAGVGVGAVLEALLLVRAARRTRARWMAVERAYGEAPPREVAEWAWRVGLAVLVALLGFALLIAFLARES